MFHIDSLAPHIHIARMVSWQHGDKDTISSKQGGLIRKNDGSSKIGLFENIGISNILHVEVQALLIRGEVSGGARKYSLNVTPK